MNNIIYGNVPLMIPQSRKGVVYGEMTTRERHTLEKSKGLGEPIYLYTSEGWVEHAPEHWHRCKAYWTDHGQDEEDED